MHFFPFVQDCCGNLGNRATVLVDELVRIGGVSGHLKENLLVDLGIEVQRFNGALVSAFRRMNGFYMNAFCGSCDYDITVVLIFAVQSVWVLCYLCSLLD